MARSHLSFFLLVVLRVYSAAGCSTFCQPNNLSNLPCIPAGYEKIGDKCYYIDTTNAMNAHEAWIACRKKNGFLASFSSIDELQALSDKLISKGFRNKNFWIDGNDFNRKGNFVWNTDGNPVSAKLFFSGEPNYLGRERCLHIMSRKQGPFRINNHGCDVKFGYICQL